jgi:hypothetical protein
VGSAVHCGESGTAGGVSCGGVVVGRHVYCTPPSSTQTPPHRKSNCMPFVSFLPRTQPASKNPRSWMTFPQTPLPRSRRGGRPISAGWRFSYGAIGQVVQPRQCLRTTRLGWMRHKGAARALRFQLEFAVCERVEGRVGSGVSGSCALVHSCDPIFFLSTESSIISLHRMCDFLQCI